MAKRVEKYPEVVFRKHPQPLSPHPSPWVRNPSRHLWSFVGALALSCAVIAVDVQFGFGWLVRFSGRVAVPVVHAVNLTLSPVAKSVGFAKESWTARDENEELRARVAELERELHRHQSRSQDYERLRDLLNLKAVVAPEAMAAEVLRYRDSSAGRVMRLRAGTGQGFAVGQPALTESGQLLGRIVEAGPSVSAVQLITDAACRIGVTAERTRAEGILYNRDGNLFVWLDRGELVREGDRILTSHLSERFPEGLLVGEIAGVADDRETDPMVAVNLGLMTSYRVEPVFPREKWKTVHEVLCLPNFDSTDGDEFQP